MLGSFNSMISLLDVILLVYGIFIVLLCWRTMILTFRIKHLERDWYDAVNLDQSGPSNAEHN